MTLKTMKKWKNETDHKYYLANREKRLLYARTYRETHRKKICDDMSKYYFKNRDLIQKKQITRHKKRILIDPSYKISCSVRARLGSFLRHIGMQKKNKTFNYIGCTKEELKTYIESKFSRGMSWDNYGKNGWHIDHIKPLCSFDLMKEEELHKACHYTNLQPLWAIDNLVKSGKH